MRFLVEDPGVVIRHRDCWFATRCGRTFWIDWSMEKSSYSVRVVVDVLDQSRVVGVDLMLDARVVVEAHCVASPRSIQITSKCCFARGVIGYRLGCEGRSCVAPALRWMCDALSEQNPKPSPFVAFGVRRLSRDQIIDSLQFGSSFCSIGAHIWAHKLLVGRHEAGMMA